MKRLYTGICCLAFLAVIIAPASADAQAPGQGNQSSIGSPAPSSADGRGYSEDAYMGYFKGKTWQEVMEEAQNTLVMEAVLTTITRTGTYDLTTLDNELTGEAIALEQVKGSLLDEVIDRITAGAKAAAQNVSKKVYGKSAGISYELLPDREAISLILPSLILVEETSKDRRKGVLKLKAKTRIALSRIVPMISAINGEPSIRSEISDVRSMAADAMREIVQIQEATAESGKTSALNQRYTDAVNRLITADQLERGRYFALQGQTQEAIDAYTMALETSPGLAVAYRNRGGVHLYLKDHAKAMADFLNAYTSDAIDHTESKDFQACLADTEAALELFEDYGTAYFHRAVCRIGLRQQLSAKNDFIKAAQLGEKRAQNYLTSKGIAW